MSELQPWRNPRTSPYRPGAAAQFLEPSARKWLRAWWPALVWAVMIFSLSTDTFSTEHTGSILEPILRWFMPTISKELFNEIHHFIRKCGHFTEYFVFCLLLYRGVRGDRPGWRWTWGVAAFSCAAGYSALDEIHQAFVVSRTASAYDSLLDSAGAFLAFALLWLWFRVRRSRAAVKVAEEKTPAS